MIRQANKTDCERLAQIEGAAYPKEEAASLERIQERVAIYGDHFWLLEEKGQIVAFINGMATDQADLTDPMYEYANLHQDDGQWQMIFSVVTDPDHQGKGYASYLMKQVIKQVKDRGHKGLVLTCKEKLLDFYGAFGFENEGQSTSNHGGVIWYQMRLTF